MRALLIGIVLALGTPALADTSPMYVRALPAQIETPARRVQTPVVLKLAMREAEEKRLPEHAKHPERPTLMQQLRDRMIELAAEQLGFLGVESARGAGGFGITVSYWESTQAIANWKANAEHRIAQETGKQIWYADYQLRVAKVERAYGKPHVQSHE